MRCVRCAATEQYNELSFALSHGLRAAQAAATQNSLWLEFGAWSGRTARIIRDAAFEVNKSGVTSFDSFEGLPEDWRGDPLNRSWAIRQFLSRGSFSRRGRPPFHEHGIRWEVGWFNETLPAYLSRHPTTPISFVHIDCDLYSSTDIVFRLIEDRLTADAVIVFDELVNYPEWREHEAKAFVELLRRTGKSYKVIGVGPRIVLPDPSAIAKALALAPQIERWRNGTQGKKPTLGYGISKLPFGGGGNEDVAVMLTT